MGKLGYKPGPGTKDKPNRERYLPYGLGCIRHANCFDCPFDDCRQPANKKKVRKTSGWYSEEVFA